MTVQEVKSKLEEKKVQLLKDHSNQVGDENWRRGEFHAIEYTLNLLNSITTNTVSIFVSRDLNNTEDFEIHETKPEIKEDGFYYSTSSHGVHYHNSRGKRSIPNSAWRMFLISSHKDNSSIRVPHQDVHPFNNKE